MLSRRLNSLKAYKTETTKARIRLSSNELPYDLPEDLKTLILNELKETQLNRYPDPNSEELREVIGDFFGVSSENILLGNGSDELIYYLSIAVGDFSQGVYVPVPTFPMYEISADMLGRPKVCVQLDENFDINLEKSLELIANKSVVLAYYSYPNNPTGNLFSKEKIHRIREEGVFTVVDEAYYSYSGESFKDEALKREDTVVLRTLSKIGLAGLRVGILIGKESVVSELNKLRLPFNVTSPSQIIAKVVLSSGRDFIEESVKKVTSERERVLKELKGIKGVEVFPSRANFILFRTPFNAKAVHKGLVERDVLIRDMSYLPGLDRCLRVSIGKPEENDIFLEALEKVLVSLN
ncbi:histidinol-phosphate aminotransferase [Hydrogenivirga caldilitoris]|uniref:Histidinol-phosphate aminotransferase n=1 Tax=Hydrogenivirga caldilitoris TaxID=246264 RepID=A0A497XP96_9AQUI|nr:histidinol-phosphate transaminase [Hydrogenivirga caldilitoris]RLJ69960.1 histidinol-phosphate aminotransferase [Hydrogenivirga caldilitoris]